MQCTQGNSGHEERSRFTRDAGRNRGMRADQENIHLQKREVIKEGKGESGKEG